MSPIGRLLLYAATCLSVTCAAVVSQSAATFEQVTGEIRQEIDRTMLEGKIPSMTVALVRNGEIAWTEGFGHTNLWAQTPAVPSSVYLIGSTYKAMSTAALLQLHEQGRFELDDPVRDHIGDLAIQNERPDSLITFRHLLTHTSGLPVAFGPFAVWSDSVPPDLSTYLQTELAVNQGPERSVIYSNMAYSLIAHIIEKMTEKPYKEHMQEALFDRLDMADTAFDPRPDMEERLSIPYVPDSLGKQAPFVRLKASVWPAGIIYGTVLDQAKWLLANLGRDPEILRSDTWDTMHTRQHDAFKGPISSLWGSDEAGYGLTWWTDQVDGDRHFAHSGSVPGYTAFIQGNRETGDGIAILSNGNRSHPYLIALSAKALALMKRIPTDSE